MVLAGIAAHPCLGGLIFKGGTARRRCYARPTASAATSTSPRSPADTRAPMRWRRRSPISPTCPGLLGGSPSHDAV